MNLDLRMEYGVDIYIASDESDESSIKWIKDFCLSLKQAADEISSINLTIKSFDEFNEKLIMEDNIHLLLVVLTKESCSSKLLVSKIDYFQKSMVRENGNATVKSNVYKILKDPIKYNDQPELIRDLQSWSFFIKDDSSAKSGFFHSDSNRSSNHYWISISALTYDIFRFTNKSEKIKNSVYLSSCSPDFLAHRQILKMELERDGYLVLPSSTYPDDPILAREMIKSDIRNCKVSIHLVGKNREENYYQSFPLSDIQYQVASNNDQPGFKKIIWTVPEIDFIDEKQFLFFEQIKKDSENKENSFILQSTLEELKATVVSFLTQIEIDQNLDSENLVPIDLPNVYLIYDYSDQKIGKHLSKKIKDFGFAVLEPEFNLDYVISRNLHHQNLEKFDIAIVVCDECHEKWIQMKLMELIKSKGYGRKKPVRYKLLISNTSKSKIDLISGFELDIQVFYKERFADLNIAEIMSESKLLRMVNVY